MVRIRLPRQYRRVAQSGLEQPEGWWFKSIHGDQEWEKARLRRRLGSHRPARPFAAARVSAGGEDDVVGLWHAGDDPQAARILYGRPVTRPAVAQFGVLPVAVGVADVSLPLGVIGLCRPTGHPADVSS